MKKSNRRVIAYSVIIPIISILAFLASPPPPRGDSTMRSSLKANMYTFQTAVELYAQDHQGYYPQNAEELRIAAKKGGYWHEFINPYTGLDNIISISEKIYSSSSYFASQTNNSQISTIKKPEIKGYIVYVTEDAKDITKYYIYAVQKDGTFIKDRGKIFCLQNFKDKD